MLRNWASGLAWIGMAAVALYGARTGYSLSTSGRWFGGSISVVAFLAVLIGLARAGFFQKQYETVGSWLAIFAGRLVVIVVVWLASWLILARALPAAWTSLCGEVSWIDTTITRHEFYGLGRYSPKRHAVLVEVSGHPSPARLEIEWAEYRRLPDFAKARARIKTSWFGSHALEVEGIPAAP